jgi:hypothetical protein
MAAKGLNEQVGAMIEFKLIKILNRYDRIIFGGNNCGRNRQILLGFSVCKYTNRRKSAQAQGLRY